MKISMLLKICVILSLTILMGCESESSEATKLGFSSVQEMNSIQSQGWHTKHQYEVDQYKIATIKAKELGFDSVEEQNQLVMEGFKTKQAYLDDKKRKEELEAMKNDPYPYSLEITCGESYRINVVPIMLCLRENNDASAINLTNGINFNRYTADADVFVHRFLTIPLAKKFHINAGNASYVFNLGIKVVSKYEHRVLFETLIPYGKVIDIDSNSVN